jgi:acetyltransferase
MNLIKMFDPRSIAIIGASNEKGSVGNALFMNALVSKKKRRIYPINIKRKRISGQESFASVREIKGEIDLAVIATPAPTVPAVMEDCAASGIKQAIIISAGFGELGAAGQLLSDKVALIAKQAGIRVMGPNCLGFLNSKADLNMSFAAKKTLPGRIAFVSQSGALCTAVLDWAEPQEIGFSRFISLGSMIDVGFADLLDYLADDKDTEAIVLYMESLKDVAAFQKACARLEGQKPIFVLKSGRSQAGAKAARSHTGSLAGNDAAFAALFRQTGISRLASIEEMFDVIKLLSFSDKKPGQRLAIVTNAGGPGVMATDALMALNGQLAKLDRKTLAQLDESLPVAWSRANPVDVIGDADPKRFQIAIRACLEDKNVDAVLLLLTPQAMTAPFLLAKELAKIKVPTGKLILSSFIGGGDLELARGVLAKGRIADFPCPERAISAFCHLSRVPKKIRISVKNENIAQTGTDLERANAIMAAVKKEKRKALHEAEAKALLAAYGFGILANRVAKSRAEALKFANELGFPLAMKIMSPDILHKVDCGGVELDIRTSAEAGLAYDRILKSSQEAHPQADIQGVYMEPMLGRGIELIIGLSQDPVLGPLIMFGRGGSEVELYKDIAFALLPLSYSDLVLMMEETRVYERLKGYRNLPGADFEQIVALIQRIGVLIKDFPEIKELDINPLHASEQGNIVLDAKVVLF